MYSNKVELDSKINLMISLFYKLGLWYHRDDEGTVKGRPIKLFYSIYHALFPISLIGGAFVTDDNDESIALAEAGIMTAVIYVKLFFIIWKEDEIRQLLNEICVYRIADHKEFTAVNEKLQNFVKFLTAFSVTNCCSASCAAAIVPFIGSEKSIFFNIYFPLDYKNDEISFWIAFVFIFVQFALAMIGILFSIVMWYLLMNCALRYGILGRQIINMGANKTIDSVRAGKDRFEEDLIAVIATHEHTKRYLQK